MNGLSLLAPVPKQHVEAALDVLKDREFVLFGSERWEELKDVDIGAKTYIYVSHQESTSEIEYTGTFLGVVGDPLEMRKLEKAGYRPASAAGEKWGCYWKVTGLEKLVKPLPLSEVQLPSGKYLRGVPRGPLLVAS